jgi:hypothetical protein
VAVLRAAEIDIVSIANNHALDYGYDALLEMLDVLEIGRSQIESGGAYPAIYLVRRTSTTIAAVTPGQAIVHATATVDTVVRCLCAIGRRASRSARLWLKLGSCYN